MIIPNIWENKIDVPNHQPVMVVFIFLTGRGITLLSGFCRYDPRHSVSEGAKGGWHMFSPPKMQKWPFSSLIVGEYHV